MIKIKKGLILISLLIILSISLGAVSAADMSVNDIISEDNTQNMEIVQEDSSQKNVEITNLSAEPGSLYDLNEEIDLAQPGATINLTKDYKYYGDYDINPIYITKSLTIDGQGHTIDGSNSARIFQISADNVTIKNINFINCKSETSGSAIYWESTAGVVSGCSFSSCVAKFNGGAIYWNGASGVVSGCSFSSCIANYSGGAIYWNGASGVVSGCSFVNCYSDNDGGAIRWISKDDGVVSGCSFVNCIADLNGGAICWVYSDNGLVSGCSFVNCYANHGGAIELRNSSKSVVNYNIFDSNAVSSIIYVRGSTDYDLNFNFFSFENDVSSFPSGLVEGGTVNNWVVLNISKDNVDYSVDFICNNGSDLNNSMPNYTAKLKINEDVKEITIKNNTFKDTQIIGDYLLYSLNSGNVLANTTLKWYSINYTISTSDCVYGENATVTVNVNDSATGNITVNVDDGQVFKGVIDNGVVIIPLSNLNVGVHNLNISYSGDSNFLPFKAIATVTVNKTDVDYTISTSDCVYGENATVTVNVNDSATGNITVNVDDGQVFNGVIDNGVVIIPLSNLNVGVHNLNISYSGDSNFLPFNATVSLTVGKVNVGVDVKVDSIVYGDDAVVDVVVNGVSGKVVPEGNVTFYINGIENGTVHINDGKCKYIFSDLSVSIYTINVVYSGDNNYLSSNATVSLTVGKVNVGVDVKVDSIVYGETAAIDVTVKGINDKIVPTGNVTLFVNGTGNITVPINDGKCNYIFSNLSAGIYNILVFYGGDDKYSYSFVAVSLTVGKVNVGVDVKVDSVVYGSDAVVDVVVNGIDGKLVPTGEVIFFVNDIKKGNVPINDGKCDFILSDLGAGIYNVSVVYSGDNNYLSSNVTTNLTVNPINVTLIPTVLTTDYDSGKYFQIKVVDNNNESITGLKLALKVFTGSSYKTVYVTTDDNGIAKYDASKLSIGTHNVTVMVSNSNYSASIKTSSIKIVKAATKITNVSTKVIKNHKYFYVKLTTKSGKALANKVVTMKSSVSGKNYKIKTNSKGIAKIDLWITYTLGKTHKYTFKYAGNSYYKAYSVTFKIKLVK